MKKSNISKIIKMFLSARFPSETEEKVQKWIIKDENQQAKAKASLDYWNELDVEADSSTYVSLERVNLRTGYNKEHLTNVASYQKFARVAAVIVPLFLLAGGMFYYLSPRNEMIEVSVAYGEQKRLILPDSSEVWLNAGSTILYPETFAKDKRLEKDQRQLLIIALSLLIPESSHAGLQEVIKKEKINSNLVYLAKDFNLSSWNEILSFANPEHPQELPSLDGMQLI